MNHPDEAEWSTTQDKHGGSFQSRMSCSVDLDSQWGASYSVDANATNVPTHEQSGGMIGPSVNQKCENSSPLDDTMFTHPANGVPNIHLMGVRMGAGGSWIPKSTPNMQNMQNWPPKCGRANSNSTIVDGGLSAEAGQMVSLLGSLPLVGCDTRTQQQSQSVMGRSPQYVGGYPQAELERFAFGEEKLKTGGRGKSTRGRPPWKKRPEPARRVSDEAMSFDGGGVCYRQTMFSKEKNKIPSPTPITTASSQESMVEIADERQISLPMEQSGSFFPIRDESLRVPTMRNNPDPQTFLASDSGKCYPGRPRRAGPPRPRGRPRKYPPPLTRDFRPPINTAAPPPPATSFAPPATFERDDGFDSRKRDRRGRPSGRGMLRAGRMRRLSCHMDRFDRSDERMSARGHDAVSDFDFHDSEDLPNPFNGQSDVEVLKVTPSDGIFTKLLCPSGDKNIHRVLHHNHPQLAQSMGKTEWDNVEKEPWTLYQMVADVMPIGREGASRYCINLTNDLLAHQENGTTDEAVGLNG
eukprot:Selendium_serpulae@DN6254_c0_g1_i11.p1